MENKTKVIFLDWSIFCFRGIFAWRVNKNMPMEYTILNMIIACLKRVGIEPCDKIIIACDKGRSWRKEIDDQYKADRKEKRDKQTDIPWAEMFGRCNSLLEKIDYGTNWQIVQIEHIEADDIMAVGSRYYKDNEVVLVTYDADMEQLYIYDNVKILSPITKKYKIVKNPYKILAKKIEKEKSDNLTNPILNEADYEKRKSIVSLIELPDFVENIVKEQFDKFQPKQGDLEEIPFRSMREKLGGLYNDKSKVVSYRACVNAKKRKKRKSNGKRKKTKGNK